MPEMFLCFLIVFCLVNRQNVDDALVKLQDCLDRAAESLIPPEVDPEKVKQIEKQ